VCNKIILYKHQNSKKHKWRKVLTYWHSFIYRKWIWRTAIRIS